ncbi:MAG TPA: tetratricopeptide repeat protein [Acidobacteriaceae bacterium]|nr:tetratricopeptide repeat protein [Acidobacteriaceae bacterium]
MRWCAWLSVVALAVLTAGVPAQNPPTSGSASVASARDLVAQGKLDDALRELDALAAEHPEAAGVERLRGIVDYQQNHMAEAEGDFTRAVEQDPSDLQSMQMRGIVLFRMNLPEKAIPILEKAHSSAPIANADPNYVLALCYIATGRYDDARHAFAAQYGFAPDSAAAWLFSGRMLFRQELTAQATTAAQRALTLDPRLPLAHRLLGEIALAKGDVPGAIAELEQEQKVNPLDGETYNRMGDAYLRQGQLDRAQQALDRAVLLEPDASGPYILLGKTMLEQHDPVMAALYLKHAEAMDPSNPMTHMLLGRAFAVSGRKDEAQREFQIVEKMQGATGAASSQH